MLATSLIVSRRFCDLHRGSSFEDFSSNEILREGGDAKVGNHWGSDEANLT